MTAKIITVAQQKGGAGKTTLAAHLGVAWADEGKRVAFFDVDPQQSLTAWFSHREANHGANENITLSAFEGWKAAAEIGRARKEADIVVIDSPPHAETAARLAIREAEIVVVPLQLSPMDVWATRSTLEMVDKEKADALIVLNRVPPRSRLADDLLAALKKDKMPLARAKLGNRTAFAASLLNGKGITEFAPLSLAAREMRAVAREILKKS